MDRSKQAWLVMFGVYFASIAVALNQFKVPPVMPVLMDQLHVDMETGGWFMSFSAIAGMVLGIPAAFVLRRLGRVTGLIALGCTILGSAVGALATNATVLLAGRAIEGIGLGLIAVVAPSVISMWFPPAERGTPMGIWASWVPVGSFVSYNLAGRLLGSFGWQGIWWFGALVALVAFILYAAVVRFPATEKFNGTAPESSVPLRSTLLNRSSWMLALAFGAFNLAFVAYGTWTPSYLMGAFGMDSAAASFNASLSSLAIIPSTMIAGWVLDRVHNRRLILSAPLLITGVLMLWGLNLGQAGFVTPFMLTLGLVGGFVPSATFTLAPDTMPNRAFAGLALGIVSVGQNLGMFIGPPVVGAAIAGGNWGTGTIPLVASLGVGLVASLLIKERATGNTPILASARPAGRE